MSRRYKGGVISATAPTTSTSAASGSWSEQQTLQGVYSGNWPRSPGAPTIGTATISGTTASVVFTAPTDLGTGSISYTAKSSPGNITNTGSSSPISVGGLTGGTSYTFTVTGTTPGGTGPSSAASNSVTAVVTGSQSYTCTGTYSWVAPAGVTSVSVVVVGSGGAGAARNTVHVCGGCIYYSGGGGGGGGLVYKNNITVVPGNSYTVNLTCAGGAKNYFKCNTAAYANSGYSASSTSGGAGGTAGGTAYDGAYSGGAGGNGTALLNCYVSAGGGGGAAGYAGAGGAGGRYAFSGSNSASLSGGGGGGGGGTSSRNGGGGGGVGLLGKGCDGFGGSTNTGGYGGSGGGCGGAGGSANAGCGGAYGGGGGGQGTATNFKGFRGLAAVRIVWPGNTRQFPSTCVGNP